MKHEIIKTDDYLLVVDDLEIKEDDWILWENKVDKKIIAHLPLNNSPILQGVDLLPPLEQEDDVEEFSNSDFPIGTWSSDAVVLGLDMYKTGYNKAKEKYNIDLHGVLSDFYVFATNGEVCNHKIVDEFIQSISQPKIPIGFECQTFDTGDDKLDGTHVLGIRTTTNSQGQSVWVGEYIYA